MVAKRAGQFAGGILNNPGALAAIGIAVSIITTLVIFRNDIRNFFGTTVPEAAGQAFGEAAVAGAGSAISSGFESAGESITEFFTNIELPTFELPSFDFTLPTIEFPSFEDVFGPSVDGDDFTDVGMAAARARQDGAGVEPSDLISALPERESISAVELVPETQEGFQERAGLFVEVLPEVTAFTSLPGSATDFVRRQLSRESEDFESVLEAEARRSETIFAGLFGNVQNPEFGA